jgi:hypothetical protein
MVEAVSGRVLASAACTGRIALFAAALLVSFGIGSGLVHAGSAGPKGFACVDVDGDGKCTAGTDQDIGPDIANGFVVTSGDIVIPANAPGIVLSDDLFVSTDGTITVNGSLKASSLSLDGNQIVLGPAAFLQARDSFLQLVGAAGVEIGPKANVQARKGRVTIAAYSGPVTLDNLANVIGDEGVDIYTLGGVMTAAKSRFSSRRGEVSVYASGDVAINGSGANAVHVTVMTSASLLEFRDNLVRIGKDGMVMLMAEGSTIDVRGTKFPNARPSQVTISAETVLE